MRLVIRLVVEMRHPMALYERDHIYPEPRIPSEHLQSPLSVTERLIRFFLLTGFLVVVGIEGWLLFQALQIMP